MHTSSPDYIMILDDLLKMCVWKEQFISPSQSVAMEGTVHITEPVSGGSRICFYEPVSHALSMRTVPLWGLCMPRSLLRRYCKFEHSMGSVWFVLAIFFQ